MSTVSSRAGRRRLPLVGRSEASTEDRPRREGRRSWTRYAVAGGLLLACVVFAPAIIARTPLVDRAIDSAAADLQGTVHAGSASLGWFSPVRLTDVDVRDANGEPLAKIPEASTERTLLGLLTGGGDPGLKLEKPRIAITLDEQGSNLERVLEKILAKADPADATPFTLDIREAELQVIDTIARKEWTIRDFSMRLVSPGNDSEPLTLTAEGTVSDAGQSSPFKVAVTMKNDALNSKGNASSGEVNFSAKRFPVEALNHVLRQATHDATSQMSGTLDGDLKADWAFGNVGLKSFGAQGKIALDEFTLATAATGDRPIELRHLEAPLNLRVKNGGLDVKQLDVQCDWGRLRATGRLADWTAFSRGQLGLQQLAPLARSTGEISAEVDVAALSRSLPGVMRLREGTEIHAGELTLKLVSAPSEQGWTWNADVLTSRVEATHAGQRIAWEKPIEVTFSAEDAGDGIVVRQLLAQSDFLQVQGEGNLDYLSFAATYELDRLAQELGRFIDFRDWQLAGEGWTYVTWQRKDADHFAADADVQVRGLAIAAGGQSWREENLLCNIDLAGQLDDSRVERIDHLKMHVDAQSDRGDAVLAGPVTMTSASQVWPFDVQLSGRIERWLARAALVTSQAAGWNARGDGQLACRLDYGRDKIDVPRFDLKANGLQMETFGFLINEPTMQMTGSGSFVGEPLRWEVREMTVKTTSLDARARNVVGTFDAKGSPEITGELDYSADLAKLNDAWRAAGAASPWKFAGQMRTVAKIDDRNGVLNADVQSDIQQFSAQYGAGPVVTDPKVTLTARGKLDRHTETLTLERGAIESESLRAEAAGTIQDLLRERRLDLRGKLDYDLAKLQGLLAPYLGEHVALTGRSSRDFALAGPLGAVGDRFAAWSGDASIGWDTAKSYGFEAGAGTLAAQLRAGKLNITPLDFVVNEGRFKLSPEVILSPAPGEVRLPREQVLSQVKITPAMCAQALSYIAPVLAGVAQADGRVSVALDGGRLPLDNWRMGDVAGKLTVHDVRVSAGPLVSALAVVLNRATEVRLTEEAQVPFRLVQGRVYHENLELNFPELTIRTRGSVGLDRSLMILAEMPVPPKWIGNNPLGTALEGQTISLPIGGTLDRPVIDQNELNRLAGQFIQNAAGRALERELGNQLNRLLGSPQ
jgi:translocation and assembly module TamB